MTHSALFIAIIALLLAWPLTRWFRELRLRKVAEKRLRIARVVSELEKGSDPLFPVMFKAQLCAELPLPDAPGAISADERALADRICAEAARADSPTGRLWADFARHAASALYYRHPVRFALLRLGRRGAAGSRLRIAAESAARVMRPQVMESGRRGDADIMRALLDQTRWLKPRDPDAKPLVPTSSNHLELFKEVLSGAIYDESAWTLVQWETRESNPANLPLRLKNAAIDALSRFLARRDIVMVHVKPFQPHVRAKGADWPLVGFSMIGRKRLDNLQACDETVIRDGVPGDLIETGVWRGGAVMLMKAILKAHGVTDRTLWIADSFAGLPKPDSESDGTDYSENKFLAVSRQRVQANFERFGLMDDRVKFLEGWFCDTLPTAPIEKLAILRLDGDLYSSTMDALVSLYPKVSKGGFVIVDDFHGWPGCKRAIQEYLLERGESPEIHTIDEDGAYWRVT